MTRQQVNEMWMADCMAAVKGLKVTIPFEDITGNPVVDIIESMKSTLLLCKKALDPCCVEVTWRVAGQKIEELGL